MQTKNANVSDYEEQMYTSNLYSSPILNFDDVQASFLMRRLLEDDQDDELNNSQGDLDKDKVCKISTKINVLKEDFSSKCDNAKTRLFQRINAS